MTSKILNIHDQTPEANTIAHAVHIIKNGGLVVFPTWCLYGLATDALNPKAIQRVFDIKKRPPENPILILIKDIDELKGLVRDIPQSAQRIMNRFWPGKVTLVFEARDCIPQILTAGTGKIGIRIPEHPVAAALVNSLPHPITGTSANISGETGCSDLSQMPLEIIDKADLVLDSGPLSGGLGSTVVDVTCDPVRIIRQGAVSTVEIFQAIS
ncbi:MAG: threonylcarbamoyl-AMP synthase [Proteobacteria bacterium]|nr:threonylcarbamoyl-AMP synthase [Pseudomonadota bacterium]